MPSSCQRTISGASILLVHTSKSALRGFSLVELAIVLVILGLLVGGILGGKSLIRAAELRNVTSESQKYIAATKSFRDKYFALPGDMNNASQFWGLRTAISCFATPSTDARTCDGDGDGTIEISVPSSRESLRYWQHLANAGLIEGSYDGVGSVMLGSANDRQLGISRLGRTEWVVEWIGTITGVGTLFNGDYANALYIDLIGNLSSGATLSPQETWNIDTKHDDGMPATGVIVAFPYATCSDAVSNATLTANYLLTETPNTCWLVYRRQL